MKIPGMISSFFRDDRFSERPFFLFLTLVMSGIYVWALRTSSALDAAWKIALFTTLMVIHVILYWLPEVIFQHPRWVTPYLLAQGVLAFSIGMLAGVSGIAFGLYPGLIGLIIGFPILRLHKISIIAFYLALSGLNFYFVSGPGSMTFWVMGTVPVVIFVSIYVLLYMRQAEARQQAQKLLGELEAANRQLGEYATRVEDLTIANERQRMARELHDTLSQGLAGLILQLEAADAHLAGKRLERGRAILQQSMEKARGTLAEARQAIDDLRRPDRRDLEEAIQREAERFSTATGIHCSPVIKIDAGVPGTVAETTIRAVSEALTNIARHAKAGQVSLRLVRESRGLEVEICDDGIGFDPEAVEAGHYGLLGMRERVRLAGGQLEVQSTSGKGTQITIRFPLEDDPHD